MWQKLKNFSKKDPLIFTLIIAVIIVAGGYGSLEAIHATSKAEFCKTCHPKESAEVRGEYYTYKMGIHSEAGVSCLDCHGAPGMQGYVDAHFVAGMRSLYHEIFTPEDKVIEDLTKMSTDVDVASHIASQDSCIFCHTDAGNKDMRRKRIIKVLGEFRMIDDVKNPAYRTEFGRPDILTERTSAGVDPNHAKHYAAGVRCLDCHLGIGHSGVKNIKPKMETCFKCHDSKRQPTMPANNDCAKCHTIQKGVQQGNYAKTVKGDKWYMAQLNCTDCHADTKTLPNAQTCTACHDATYGSMLKDIQSAFTANLAKAKAVRDKLKAQRASMPEGRLAIYNELNNIVRIAENDGSKGFHNPDYFDMMFAKVDELKKAYDAWKPEVVKEATDIKAETKAAPKAAAKPAGPVNKPEEMAMLQGSEVINLAERHVPAPTKDPVKFAHKDHASRIKCSECHKEPGVLKFEVKDVKGPQNVFHTELCVKCHKEQHASTSCTTCHKK